MTRFASLARLAAFLEARVERPARLAITERTRLTARGRGRGPAQFRRRAAFRGASAERRLRLARPERPWLALPRPSLVTRLSTPLRGPLSCRRLAPPCRRLAAMGAPFGAAGSWAA